MLELHLMGVDRSCTQGGRRRLVGLSHVVSVPSEVLSVQGDLPLDRPHVVPAVCIIRIVEALIAQFAS